MTISSPDHFLSGRLAIISRESQLIHQQGAQLPDHGKIQNNISNRAYKCKNIRVADEYYCNEVHLTGADLGFSERGANHSSGSLKQGVWGHSPPEAIGYFVL